jgi:tetrahydromethanopterin S-methyltransferase subunit B
MDILEKIGALGAKADAAHSRVDKLETVIRDDLKMISAELKELNAFMHRGKGWAAAAIFASGIVGAALTKVAALLFSGH